MGRRLAVLVVLAVALSLAASGAAFAVLNGQPDGDGYPYVGLVTDD